MKVIFVVGPTASGKSDLALAWAEKFGGAIVNCDSIQLFKSLDIGSAKPSPDDFRRVPHFLFDCIEEGAEMTAGQYVRCFFETLGNLRRQFPVVFVVGGTGFYFQAIEKGMYPIGAADPQVISQVERELQQNPAKLYEELREKDPETAQKISPNDHYRLARAVEMMRTHGRAVSEIKKEFEASRAPFPYPLLKIGISAKKENLLPRVQARTKKMLERGLVSEVQSLLAKGLSGWSALQSVGYKECLDYLAGRLEGPKALEELIVQNTMRLAKKQRTWFQRDSEIIWIENSEAERGTQRIQEFLKSDLSASELSTSGQKPT